MGVTIEDWPGKFKSFSPCSRAISVLYRAPFMNALPDTLQQVDRTYVLHRNRKLSYFSGCDYYRLASHPAILDALREALDEFGLNVAASRKTTGNHSLYEKLECRLARFFGAESAVLFSSGYAANWGVAQALAGEFSHALLDERAHVSLVDAAQMLNCPVIRFEHRNPDAARAVVRRLGRFAKPILLTDGLFSHDGSIAPLAGYLEALPNAGRIWVDEAHAAGVLGRTGQGTVEHLGLRTNRIIRTMTLSKAFGVYGGAALGTRGLRQRIHTKSGLFVGNTPMPLPLAGAALRAVELLGDDGQLRLRLASHVRYVKSKLLKAGYPVPDTPSPIIALIPNNRRDIERGKRLLLARRIYPPLIQYPGGPETGYFRFALSSEHRREQLDQLLGALLAFSDLTQAGKK